MIHQFSTPDYHPLRYLQPHFRSLSVSLRGQKWLYSAMWDDLLRIRFEKDRADWDKHAVAGNTMVAWQTQYCIKYCQESSRSGHKNVNGTNRGYNSSYIHPKLRTHLSTSSLSFHLFRGSLLALIGRQLKPDLGDSSSGIFIRDAFSLYSVADLGFGRCMKLHPKN